MRNDGIFINTKLPEPLDKNELIECFKKFYNGDINARNKIVTHNIKLVYNIIITYYKGGTYELKELFSVGLIGLIKAADTFDINSNYEFSTYAFRCIRNQIITFIKLNQKHLDTTSLEKNIFKEDEGSETLKDVIVDENSVFSENLEKKELLSELKKQIELLSERDKKLIKLFYGIDCDRRYSQKEIADILNMKRSNVAMRLRKIVSILKGKLEILGLIDKKTKVKTRVNK